MKHRTRDLDLGDPEMRAARAALAEECAAAPPVDDLEWRIARARAAVAPAEALGFVFTPGTRGKFEVRAITKADLAMVKNE